MTDFSLITVEDFKVLAPDVDLSSYADPTVSGMIASASKQVSDYLEYNPLAEDVIDEVKNGMITTDGDLLVFPNKVPVIRLDAMAVMRGTSIVNMELNGTLNGQPLPRYNIDYTGRNIRYPWDEATLDGSPIILNFLYLRGSQFYTKISYRGGFEVSQLPWPIKQATALFVREFLQPSYNTQGLTRLQQGGISFGFGGNGQAGRSKLVQDAERLLGPYKRVG